MDLSVMYTKAYQQLITVAARHWLPDTLETAVEVVEQGPELPEDLPICLVMLGLLTLLHRTTEQSATHVNTRHQHGLTSVHSTLTLKSHWDGVR